MRGNPYQNLDAVRFSTIGPIHPSLSLLALWAFSSSPSSFGTVKNFTTETRRTQRKKGERKLYIPLPFSALRFSVSSASPWLFSFFDLQHPSFPSFPPRFLFLSTSLLSFFSPCASLCLRGYFPFYSARSLSGFLSVLYCTMPLDVTSLVW